MLSRHPGPGLKHALIDGIQHLWPGGFISTVGPKAAAASHERQQRGMGAGREVPPPPLSLGTDLGHDGSASGDVAEVLSVMLPMRLWATIVRLLCNLSRLVTSHASCICSMGMEGSTSMLARRFSQCSANVFT